MDKKKTLHVTAIKDGTVIDHIPAEHLFKVIRVLGLESISTPMAFGTNMDSKKLDKKGLIKLWNVFLEETDINRIALIAETAVINVIRDYKVVEKKAVTVPNKLYGMAKCVNPKCVTNHENMQTKFTVVNTGEVSLKCDYCDKITDKKNFKFM